MVRSAAPIAQATLDAIRRLDDPDESIAEIARRVAADAARRGQTRPGCEKPRRNVRPRWSSSSWTGLPA